MAAKVLKLRKASIRTLVIISREQFELAMSGWVRPEDLEMSKSSGK